VKGTGTLPSAPLEHTPLLILQRCTRSCFQCPICVGPLSVTNIETPSNPSLLTADNAAPASGPYILTCSYCQWSSTEIGIKFDKPNSIYAQLQRLRNGGATRLTPKERRDTRKDATAPPATGALDPVSEAAEPAGAPAPGAAEVVEDLDPEAQFANLRQFYQMQMSETAAAGGGGLAALGDLGFGSPGSLSRIMSLYTQTIVGDKTRAAKTRVANMREALGAGEGFQAARLGDEAAAVAALAQGGWEATASAAQQAGQPPNAVEPQPAGRARFVDALRPVPYLLRTKRSKRCSACRHIMSKPEPKINSNRFRIRLVAGNYIPSIAIRPLAGPVAVTASAWIGAAAAPPEPLPPLKPVQFLLTFKNPIFETVKVTLATPAVTPGRFASKVTVLCPQFEIDANTDVWDEALKDGEAGRRRRRGDEAQHQAEAGKIWERGRNWVSIVVEVVPASLRLTTLAMKGGEKLNPSPLKDDEDVLEIPMFVRVEWEGDPAHEEVGSAPGKDRDAREKRELAYWCVLGLGRISQE